MKSFLALIILIFLTACTNTRYYYYPENYKNSDISIIFPLSSCTFPI